MDQPSIDPPLSHPEFWPMCVLPEGCFSLQITRCTMLFTFADATNESSMHPVTQVSRLRSSGEFLTGAFL